MSQIGGVADKGRITQEMWSFFSVSHDRIDVSDIYVFILTRFVKCFPFCVLE